MFRTTFCPLIGATGPRGKIFPVYAARQFPSSRRAASRVRTYLNCPHYDSHTVATPSEAAAIARRLGPDMPISRVMRATPSDQASRGGGCNTAEQDRFVHVSYGC